MVVQYIIIGILFIAAVAYLLRQFYKSFFSKDKACGGSCNCSAIDMERIEKQIEERMRKKSEHRL